MYNCFLILFLLAQTCTAAIEETKNQGSSLDLAPVIDLSSADSSAAAPIHDAGLQDFLKLIQDPELLKLFASAEKSEKEVLGLNPLQEVTLPLSSLEQPQDQAQEQHIVNSPRFYDTYLARYFPKVFVIRAQFVRMTVEQCIEALRDIIDLFTEEPWFYFVNKQEGFKITHYWEYLIDQLVFLSEFVQRARVDNLTNKLFLPEKNLSYFDSYLTQKNNKNLKNSKLLRMRLTQQQKDVIADFYALCFDYEIKLFNEGILLKNSKIVERYYRELEFVFEQLQGTIYEVDYLDAMKTCKELSTRLKTRLGKDDFDMLGETFAGDEKMQKLMQEANDLGI
jgi:hypothetical protein